MKKIISVLLTVVMLCSLCITPALAVPAYNSDVTIIAEFDEAEIETSTTEQTVVLTIKASKKVDLYSIGYKVSVPSGWTIAQISGGSSGLDYSGTMSSTTTGRVSWYSGANVSTNDDGVIGQYTITVPANVAVDSYSATVSEVELATVGHNDDDAWMSNGFATASIDVVLPHDLEGLTVTNPPTKTSYISGHDFDSTGMEITANFTDGNEVVTGWTVTNGSNLAENQTSVTISYTDEEGVTKTVTQAITVTPKSITGISVKTNPSKTSYIIGESFNASGLKITVAYNNGKTEDITSGFTCSPTGALNTLGTNTITVSYGGFTTTFNVTVNPIVVTGISLNKFFANLTVGQTDTLVATVTPSNATNKDVEWTSSDPSVVKVENGKITAVNPGTATITAKTVEGGKVARCSVTVRAQQLIPYTQPMYKITFDTNGGSAIEAIEVASGDYIDISNCIPVKEGFVFEGWYADKAMTQRVEAFKMDGNKTVYALWSMEETPVVVEPFEPILPVADFPFVDVTESDWSYDDVYYVWANGLMNGTSETTFAPKATTTRAMIVTILWRLDGEGVTNYSMQFEDVPEGEWYTEAIRWAASEKIVTGYSDTKFGPNDPITREQLAAILYRYAEYAGFNTEIDSETNFLSFDDVFEISEYAKPAMFWALQNGLINGTDEGKLNPKGNATREQVAAILHRFVENVVTPEIEKALTQLFEGLLEGLVDVLGEGGELELGDIEGFEPVAIGE